MFENEIPKHRKKRSGKKVAKSDHKHDYVLTEVCKSLNIVTSDGRVFVTRIYNCSICDKVNTVTNLISKEEFDHYQSLIRREL